MLCWKRETFNLTIIPSLQRTEKRKNKNKKISYALNFYKLKSIIIDDHIHMRMCMNNFSINFSFDKAAVRAHHQYIIIADLTEYMHLNIIIKERERKFSYDGFWLSIKQQQQRIIIY